MGSFAEDWKQCARSPADNSSWEKFLVSQKRVLTGIVFRVARRFGIDSLDEVDDAVQEICFKISCEVRFDKVCDGEDGIIEAYMKALIANAAHDYFRGQRAKRRDLLACVPFNSDVPHEIPASKSIEGEILFDQLESLAGQDARSRRVFGLYYRFGWTAKEIARIPNLGLSAKGVESLVYRLTLDLRQKMQTEQSEARSGEKEPPPHSP